MPVVLGFEVQDAKQGGRPMALSSPSPRRIEQTSGHILSLNYGTLYPSHVRLQER